VSYSVVEPVNEVHGGKPVSKGRSSITLSILFAVCLSPAFPGSPSVQPSIMYFVS